MNRVGIFVLEAQRLILMSDVAFTALLKVVDIMLTVRTSRILRLTHPCSCSIIHHTVELYILQRHSREMASGTDIAEFTLRTMLVGADEIGCASMRCMMLENLIFNRVTMR
jgi:hypothetical protein